MKLKFFLTIFFVLLVTAISISATHFHFFRLERMRLIELNLQQNATLILDSDLTLTKKEFLQKGNDYIDQIIGDEKVNIIVAIYSLNGNLLYENENAEIFGAPKTLSGNWSEWEDDETGEYLIKYLTRKSNEQKRIVKVGMVLNQSLLRWKYLSQRLFIYAALILVIVTVISFILTTILFRPIHVLANGVNAMAEKLEKGDTADFKWLFQQTSSRYQDEFSALLESIQKLALKITESHNITKRWSAMMAHELKTPLTILKNRVESLSLDGTASPLKISQIDEEMLRMEHMIQDFLEWASFENDPGKPEIHAVSPAKRCDYIVKNLQATFPERQIDLAKTFPEDMKLFCHPIHFDQMLSNLITNAVKYGEGTITVIGTQDFLSVKDEGKGIPPEVLEKIGTPFNHGTQTKGTGLGLAWVNTICRKYNWKLHIQGSEVLINFPSSEAA